ncbi:unnamed protein product [Callosobruchus maculatus]|uniref:Uncharacterized protein n=1 Tax=Callosobruchus maculatus TaxID=64391 RepID=A0A653C2L2_CALMS|nr:unnamed protein product [Callosobruchus maculatus]
MLSLPYTAHRTNVSILDELGNPKRLSSIVSTRMFTFFGHIHRSDKMEKLVVQGHAPIDNVFMAELRAYLDFNSDSKPVVTKEMLEGSSDSQEGIQEALEEAVEEEPKAKSPVPVSEPSKSHSKEKGSRSASKGDGKVTPRGNSTNGRPYGFVIPPSPTDQNRPASAADRPSKNKPWFNQRCKDTVSSKSQQYKEWRKNPNAESHRSFIAARNHCKRVTDSSKEEHN